MTKAAFITMKNWRDCGSCPSMLVRLVYTVAWLIQCVSLGFVAYLWHVDEIDYLLGHEEELEDFANDVPLSVSYSYDPVTQFLNYIDNGNFSVNGVLADVPLILHQRL
ncbi:hypothetical protein CMV_027161 [Castanea mollissima]|uniref:glycerophosphodiester phosphodiesterase n=1 Tax=Castanea mollissima TaxID=60419 RepID=A0A8J4QC29_9ROSI|nr:hypothetical protein CMV_027161 [Castanea mollissima]